MSRTRRMAVRDGKRVQWWEDDDTRLPEVALVPEPPPPTVPPPPCPNGCPLDARYREPGSGRLRCRTCDKRRTRMRRIADRIATAAVALQVGVGGR